MASRTDEQTQTATRVAALPDETPQVLATAIQKYIGDRVGEDDFDVEGFVNDDGSIECVIGDFGSFTFPTIFSFDETEQANASSIVLTVQTGDDQVDQETRTVDELYESFRSNDQLNEKVRSFYRHAQQTYEALDEADAPENNKRLGALITIAVQGAHELIQTARQEE